MEIHLLTKEDVKAFKTSDDVSFHTRDGKSVIRFTRRRGKTVDGWTSSDRINSDLQYEIPVRATWELYAQTYTGDPQANVQAFAMISASRFNDIWWTVANLVRVGDEVLLHWIADNNNGYVNDAGLHNDELRLIVLRKGRRMSFSVYYNTHQDNLARTVQVR